MSWLRSKLVLSLALDAIVLNGMAVRAADDAKKEGPAEASGEKKCPVTEKVTSLLESWKAVAAEAKSVPEAERAKLGAELASLSKECPIGSRMGETIGFVKAVLASSVSMEEACKGECPIAASGDKAAIEAKQARTKLLAGLNDLAGNATAALGAPCCAKEAASSATAAKDAPACAKELAAKAASLKASWEKVPAELAAITPEKKKQTFAAFGALAARSKAVGLLPETVHALGDGFEALGGVNGKLCAWAEAHPDALKSVPEEKHKAIEAQLELERAAGAILKIACDASKSCAAECGAAKATAAGL